MFHIPTKKAGSLPPAFFHDRNTLERILQTNAHAIGILIHFIDDLLSPRSLIQVEAHIRLSLIHIFQQNPKRESAQWRIPFLYPALPDPGMRKGNLLS